MQEPIIFRANILKPLDDLLKPRTTFKQKLQKQFLQKQKLQKLEIVFVKHYAPNHMLASKDKQVNMAQSTKGHHSWNIFQNLFKS